MGGKSRGKGKGKGKRRKPLSDEKRAEIKEKQEARAAEEGREEAGDKIYTGELVKRSKFSGWIKPTKFGQFPPDIKTKINDMVQEKKKKAADNDNDHGTFNQKVIYVRMCDVVANTRIAV